MYWRLHSKHYYVDNWKNIRQINKWILSYFDNTCLCIDTYLFIRLINLIFYYEFLNHKHFCQCVRIIVIWFFWRRCSIRRGLSIASACICTGHMYTLWYKLILYYKNIIRSRFSSNRRQTDLVMVYTYMVSMTSFTFSL